MAAMPVSWIFGRLSLESTRDDLVTSEQALKVRIESAKKRVSHLLNHRYFFLFTLTSVVYSMNIFFYPKLRLEVLFCGNFAIITICSIG